MSTDAKAWIILVCGAVYLCAATWAMSTETVFTRERRIWRNAEPRPFKYAIIYRVFIGISFTVIGIYLPKKS